MSKKYNEIMDKVVVTDEMRERLLAKIRDADPGSMSERYKVDDDTELADAFSGRRKKRPGTARILTYLAAACAVFIFMGAMATMIGMRSSNMGSTAMSENVVKEDTADQEEAAAEAAADEGAAELYDAAETDTIVGSSGNMREEAETEDAPYAADIATAEGGAAGNTADTGAAAAEPVELSETEIREIVVSYIGKSYKITDMTENGNLLIYTIAGTDSGEASTYIRIDLSSGRVEIEDVHTKEIREMYFQEMAEY